MHVPNSRYSFCTLMVSVVLYCAAPGMAESHPESSAATDEAGGGAVEVSQDTSAAEPDRPEENAIRDDNTNDGRSLFIVPGLGYSQETSMLFAAFGSYTFPLANTGEETRPSTVNVALVYTLENQASASLWSTFYLGQANDWSIENSVFIERFPTHYYGVGMSSEPSYQVYTRRRLRGDNILRRRVYRDLYVGGADHLSFYDVDEIGGPFDEDGEPTDAWSADDRIGSGNLVGEGGGTLHGLGLVARWDSRDNDQSARQGLFVDFETAHYVTLFGSDTTFLQETLDVRGYVPVGPVVLAAQWKTVLSDGDVPFLALPELGGDQLLRGMYQGRYRDQSMTVGQVEVRTPIYRRLGGVAFSGAGLAINAIGEAGLHGPRWTAGGGLRYLIDPEVRSTVRLDYGVGPDGGGVVFTFAEAF